MKNGLVLGLDTCGAESSLALARNGELLRNHTLAPRTAGAQLTSALRDLFGANGLQELQAIVVVRGPGSFTGMRIGLSAAKALSEATGAPIVAVSRLAVLAQVSASPMVALDAGRGNVYLRAEANGEERLVKAAGMRASPGEVAVCEARVAALFPHARLVPAPTASDALRYGWSRVGAGDWDDVASLDALYLWRPEEMLERAVNVRAMREEDVASVVEIATRVPTAPHWPPFEFARMVQVMRENPHRRGAWVACSAAMHVLGFAMAMHVAGTAELEAVVTAPEYRRQGVGRALVEAVLTWARAQDAERVVLEARVSNGEALELYRRLGFQRDGLRPRYYRNPDEDAVLLSFSLRAEPAGIV